jgi:hypothetical protein
MPISVLHAYYLPRYIDDKNVNKKYIIIGINNNIFLLLILHMHHVNLFTYNLLHSNALATGIL